MFTKSLQIDYFQKVGQIRQKFINEFIFDKFKL